MRACKDCGDDLRLTRQAHQAIFCLPCAESRRRSSYRKHYKRNRERKQDYARRPDRRIAAREAARRYKQTEKGRIATERAESKPERIAYLEAYNADPAQKQRVRERRQRWRKSQWTGRVKATPWIPFTVPDYLK